jgi:antitoxin VapB
VSGSLQIVFTICAGFTPLIYLGVNLVMALNIKNSEVERLATDVARITGETKTEAIRKALQERKVRLSQQIAQSRRERWVAFLEQEVWAAIPAEQLGRAPSQEEQDDILGYGPEGI